MTNGPIRADSSRDALVAQLDEVWTALAELGDRISDDEWRHPTPCPGWTVADQYAHVIGTESMLLGRPSPEQDAAEPPAHVRNKIGEMNEAWIAALAPLPRQEVLDRLAEVTAERLVALRAMTDEDFDRPSWTPVGQADYRRFMQIRVFDCWVHAQDIRDALGQPGDESGPVADQAVDEMVRAAGYIIGKKSAAPAGSSVRIVLTGPVQREIDVEVAERARLVDHPVSEAPTVTLTMSSTTYRRLSCGRADADEVSRVDVSGDADLGARVLAHLGFTI